MDFNGRDRDDGGCRAHAGHDDLVRFIEACDPQRVVLMHGENRQILADALEGREVLMPQEGKWYTL